MNINRQNYEEFFLMYVDNELSEAQRTEVEAFVKQNPDLSEELAMLQESVLIPDTFTFAGKENLYKSENSININNYEEYFLLDVDNELNKTDKAEVEKFVLQHPKLQDEYTLLQQTRLQPEVIEFKNKASLYRTEEKERRVIPMRFVKLAVAASVIGLMATIWFVYPGNKEDNSTLATIEKPVIKSNNKPSIVQPLNTPEEIITTNETSSTKSLALNESVTSNNKKVVTNVSANKVAIKTETVQPEKSNQIIGYTVPKQEVETRITEIPIETISEPAMASNVSNKNIESSNASFARPTVYKEVDTDDDDEKSFLIGSVEINKNKLRGLIKKAANLLDKKDKNNDSEKTIQIASFEIKTR